jgi:hypothetical protein
MNEGQCLLDPPPKKTNKKYLIDMCKDNMKIIYMGICPTYKLRLKKHNINLHHSNHAIFHQFENL